MLGGAGLGHDDPYGAHSIIEVKLYQKANAYHLKSYAYYNGAHGPIRPPARRHPPLPRRRIPPPAAM